MPLQHYSFIIDLVLPTTLWTEVDATSIRNNYQGYLLLGRGRDKMAGV
jgi:hypothetical protein